MWTCDKEYSAKRKYILSGRNSVKNTNQHCNTYILAIYIRNIARIANAVQCHNQLSGKTQSPQQLTLHLSDTAVRFAVKNGDPKSILSNAKVPGEHVRIFFSVTVVAVGVCLDWYIYN